MSNVWSAISDNGVAGLCFLPYGTKMDGPRNVKLCLDKLKMHKQSTDARYLSRTVLRHNYQKL